MVNYQVLKRKAVSQRVRELSCSQTNKQTDNAFYLRRSTGFASRSANNWEYFPVVLFLLQEVMLNLWNDTHHDPIRKHKNRPKNHPINMRYLIANTIFAFSVGFNPYKTDVNVKFCFKS